MYKYDNINEIPKTTNIIDPGYTDYAMNKFMKQHNLTGDLKELIRTTPFTQIGKMYNVSDNTIRKWCDKYNLPRKATEIKAYQDAEWESI